MSEKLKPCPFCGGEAVIRDNNGLYIECHDCHMRTPPFMRKYKNYAIDMWNKRPNPWHTGTPTITGFYAVKFKDGGYDVILYDNGKVLEGDDPLCGWDIYSDDKPEDIIKWQLLEEASK